MAARKFNRSASNFRNGLNGLLDLIDGCPEMLAEGLAEGDSEISESEWKGRFENSFDWLRSYFYTVWFGHYDVSMSDLEDILEEHDIDLEDEDQEAESLPSHENDTCACGTSIQTEAPVIITRWKEAREATAVCFECFGQIQTRIAVSE